MTWAERVGDLATNVTLVILATIRIVTVIVRFFFVIIDSLVTDLGRRTEEGLGRTGVAAQAWVRLPGQVLLGVALAILQLLAIFTVLLRQAATKLDDFFRGLAEGEEMVLAPPAPPAD